MIVSGFLSTYGLHRHVSNMKNYKRYLRIYKGVIISVLVIIISIVLFLTVLFPFFKKLLVMRDNVLELQENIQLLEQKIAVLDGVDDQILREHLSSLDAAVPTHKSIQTLLSTIDGLNARSGLRLENVSITAPGKIATESAVSKSSDHKQIPLSFSVRGTIAQMRAFLELTSKVKRILSINNVSLTFGDTSAGTASLNMSTFYEPLESFQHVIDKPLSPFTEQEVEILTAVAAMPWYARAIDEMQPIEYTNRSDPFTLR